MRGPAPIIFRNALVLSAICLLAACGGGGGGGGGSSSNSSSSGASSSGGSSSGGSSSGGSSSGGSSSGGSSSGASSSSGGSSGGGSSAFWLPYISAPASSSSSGATTGLVVVPSNSQTTAPALVANTSNLTSAAQLATGSYNLSLSGTTITSFSPSKFMYVAADSSSNVHVYGLPLDSSSAPTAAAIGTFSQPLGTSTLSQVVCATAGAQTSIQSPTTLFAVIDVAGSGGCGNSDTFWLVNYADANSTAPTQLSIPGVSFFEPLYSASTYGLTQIVLFDTANHALDIYPFSSGTPLTASPTVALQNVNSAALLRRTSQQAVLFLDITLTSAPTQHLVYRLGSGSTTATLVYTAAAGNTLAGSAQDDGTNLYFIDAGTTSQKLVQVGLGSGSPVTLYTNNGTNMSLLVADGNHVLMALQTASGTSASYQWSFYPLVVGSANQTLPASPSHLTGASLSSFTGEQTAGDPATQVALINLDTAGTSPGTTEHFSVIVNAAGSAVGSSNQAVANSRFVTGTGGFLGSSGYALQLIGITDPQVGDGGASIYAVPLSTGVAGTALQLTGTSAPYVVPSGTLLAAVSFAPQIGEIYDITGSSSGTSFAFDLSKGQLSTVTLPNSVVTPL